MIVEITNGKNVSTPLNKVTAAASKASELESCVLIEVTAEAMTLTALNKDTHQLRLRVPDANPIDEGQVLINAGVAKDLFSKLDETPTNLSVDEVNKQLLIKGSHDLNLPLHTTSAANFPCERVLPPIVGVVDAQQLVRVLEAASDLVVDGEFVTMIAKGDQFIVYTRGNGGSLFSRHAIELRDSVKDWELELPVGVLKYLPSKLQGLAELRLHDEFDSFAIACGHEHLLIKTIVNDTTSREVESWMSMQTPDFLVVKGDKLTNDLQVALIVKDADGMSFEHVREHWVSHCSSSIVTRAEKQHLIIDVGGTISKVFVDPKMMLAAVDTLGAKDLVIEQLKEKVPGFEKEEEENVWLRLTDKDQPDRAQIVVATLV